LNPHRTRSLFQLRFILGLIAAFGSQTAVAAAPPVVADAQITFALGLGNPQGIAVSNKGVLYVADTANNRVVTISSTGVVCPVSTTGATLNGPGPLPSTLPEICTSPIPIMPGTGSRAWISQAAWEAAAFQHEAASEYRHDVPLTLVIE
jgi:NHL repeat